jgi:hypothetical protein
MSFASDVRRISKGMQIDLETVAAEIFKELFASIVKDTPVDEGRLQGNWQTTLDTPASGDVQRTGIDGSLAEIEAKIRKPAVYYLTNNLPYAQTIEFDGWSHTKAPQGMVRINVRRTKAIVRKRASAYKVT